MGVVCPGKAVYNGICLLVCSDQTRNIVLVGLVHGVIDYLLIGLETQLSFLILLACIGLTAIARLLPAGQTKHMD